MKQLFILLLFILSGCILQAQQLETFAAAGSYETSANGSLSWVVGECFTETYHPSTSGNILTHGVLQSDLLISSIDGPAIDFSLSLYPNPASTHVILETDQANGLRYELYDMVGNVLDNKPIESDKTMIPLESLPAALYFIKVSKNNTDHKIYKIVKQ